MTGEANAAAGGPPRFFALATLPDGTLLAGTSERGMVRSVDGGLVWESPAQPPESDAVYAFTLLDNGDLLAGTGSGVWRSRDGGVTWGPLGAEGTIVYVVARDGDDLLAGTEGAGLLRSSDSGRTWTPEAVPGIEGRSVYRLLVVDGGVIAATDAGVWRLERSGARGRAAVVGLEGIPVYALTRDGGDALLAGTRGYGVARSTDEGVTWESWGDGLPDPGVTCLLSDGATVYAGTGAGVARTTDGGRVWSSWGDGLANYRIFSLTAHAATGIVAGSYDSVWALAPEQRSWGELNTGLVHDALSVSLDASGRLFAGATDGLLRSDDAGATWQPAGTGLAGIRVHRVARLLSGGFLAGTDDGVFRAHDHGLVWRHAGLSDHRVRCVLEVEPGIALAGTIGSGLYRSVDDGRSWLPVDTGFNVPLVFDILRTDAGAVLLATGDATGTVKTGAVLRSDDSGRTWTVTCKEPVTSYRAVQSASGALFVGAQRSTILRSRNGGATWDALDTTGLFDAKLWALALDREGRLFLGTGKGLLRSGDEAETWEMLDEGLDGVTVYDLRAHPSGALVAATSIGVLRSLDDGRTWL